jgi:hypothetical protein
MLYSTKLHYIITGPGYDFVMTHENKELVERTVRKHKEFYLNDFRRNVFDNTE